MLAIRETTAADRAFGPSDLRRFMPKNIPAKFREFGATKWNKLFEDWFFNGLSSLELTPKAGVDKEKALAHIKVIMGSWEPKHEDKDAACAFLFSEWFEDATWTVKGRE
jgi:hypothetical protein